ncbi:hypothetical protein AV530_002673 [Patagioenas fasciata monilis]|uniref:Peptidase A2 domain-containing protein n=1 Tax=Patagioenas fasciata monilis TaxID=372326 RepID=A0A1V4K4N9_PATFA|nr:hypothetical protein AV530_002673 [Patagioenas fasciata monilis]
MERREDKGFGSTGCGAFLTIAMNRRPTVTACLEARGRKLCLLLLLDTGADLTILDEKVWPHFWPLKHVDRGVEGVGGYTAVRRSCDRILISIEDKSASVPITVMPLPAGVNGLVGRDVLDQLGVILTTEKVFR